MTLRYRGRSPSSHPAPPKWNNAIRRGIDFLCVTQNKNGSWGGPRNTKGLDIYAPVPGAHHAFRAAVTSMAISTLLQSSDSRSEVVRAIKRGEAWLYAELPKVRRANGTALYNNRMAQHSR